MKSFAFKKPVIFSIIIITLAVSFTEIPLKNLYSHFFNSQYSYYFAGITGQGIASIVLIILLNRLELVKKVGLTLPPNKWKELWVLWPIVVLTIINFSSLFDGSLVIDMSKPITIGLYTLTYFSTGLFEEVLLRGIVLFVLLNKWQYTKKGIQLSVIVSSILFAIPHIVNFIQNRMSFGEAITTIIFSTFIGVSFAACVLRIKSIWPNIILHAIFNFGGSIKQISIGGGIQTTVPPLTVESALSSIIITLPLLFYGLFIIRKLAPINIQSNNVYDVYEGM